MIPCRQILIHQPNRNFVRALVISEKFVRLVHVDRDGTYVTPKFDIHDKTEDGGAYTFVRWVLGLCSFDEKDLGLDTSIQWTTDDAGKKSEGTIVVNEHSEETGTTRPVTYDLNMNEPPLVRHSIRGRGTTIWNAIHPETGEAVIIKDSWRAGTRVAEGEYIREANKNGVKGVPQMLAFEDDREQTIDYRPQDFQHSTFLNRKKSRLVVEKSGSSIWYFRTRLQLLRAILAAIRGTSCLTFHSMTKDTHLRSSPQKFAGGGYPSSRYLHAKHCAGCHHGGGKRESGRLFD